jgi:hypothetical protein
MGPNQENFKSKMEAIQKGWKPIRESLRPTKKREKP